MKKLLTCVVTLGCAFTVWATIAVDLRNDAGIVNQPDGLTPVDQAFVQLIWTPSYNTLFNIAGIGGSLASGEVLLNSLTTSPLFAGTWSDQAIGVQQYTDGDVGGAINSGYFFVRIFDTDAMDFGDLYLQQYVQNPTLTEYNPLDTGTIYDTNGQLGGTLGNFQVIPEPATFILFAMGGFGAWIIRRKNLRASEEA